jgi:NAD(P)-dependent dehydrogenase (short-subunit alcohol dehydrogenase family)
MANIALAARAFTAADQEKFAAVSGDRNPMHLDPLAARRTQAGAPVVHGIHLLLWALDILAATDPDLPPIQTLRVRFHQFLYVDESAALRMTKLHPDEARLTITAGQALVAVIRIRYGKPCPGPVGLDGVSVEVTHPGAPLDMSFEELADRSGRVPFIAPEMIAGMFRHAAQWVGAARIAALGAATCLVGMVCPGLHSIFTELSIRAHDQSAVPDSLAFRVTATDHRFRTVVQEIVGGGLSGSIVCFSRRPPVQQPGFKYLTGLIGPNEFLGSTVLIVGGSRGLGELTAKLIAAGGGKVILTFQRGVEDADRVVREIRSSGGVCDCFRFDGLRPVEEQLAGWSDVPTHLYYFATPPIFRPSREFFDRSRLQEFLACYVDGFWALVQALSIRKPDLSIFYPSSSALDSRPSGITEYTMAKAAGEILCADINAAMAPLRVTVSRLPRLSTDQTMQVTADDAQLPSAAQILLPLIRETQSWPQAERVSAQAGASK